MRLLTSRCAKGALSTLALLSTVLILQNCGNTSADGGDRADGSAGGAGADGGTDGACGPQPAIDCFNPCTQETHVPVCTDGSWTCDDPLPSECGGCGPMPGGYDCLDPCANQLYSPSCENGNWVCTGPSSAECPDAAAADADAGCGPIGNLVPVSCTPFPESTSCDPFGVWSLSYDTPYTGACVTSAIGKLEVVRGADGIARVGFDSTSWATLSDDGCQLEVESKQEWTNPSESGTLVHTLSLTLSPGATVATGELVSQEQGLCTGSGISAATAAKTSG